MHEISTANVLLRGGPGIWPVKVEAGVHKIGTANFVLGGASVAREEGGRLEDAPRMWSAKKGEGVHEIGTARRLSWQGKKGARTKLAQRSLCLRLPPLHVRNWHSEFRAQRCSWHV